MNRSFFRAAMFIAACSVLLLSCDTSPTGPAVVGGFYTYTAFDTSGAAVVTGAIVLLSSSTPVLTGSWNLQSAGNNAQVGPQVGHGMLTGSMNGDVSINMNPSMVDNNVILLGKFDRNEITGTWQWISFIGVTSEGRFTMRKR